jgi:DNA primase (bacterial type)
MVGVDISNIVSLSPSPPAPPLEDQRSRRDRGPLHFKSNGPISVATQEKLKQLHGKAYSPDAWVKLGVLEGAVREFPAIAFPLPGGGYKACLYTRPDPKRGKRYIFWFADGGKPDLLLVGEGPEVLVTAGEWDMLAALTAGIPCVATGTAGETFWKEEWSKGLVCHRVLIAYDVDDTGRRGSVRVADSLTATGREVYIVRLPLSGKEEEDGKDISDLIDVYGAEALLKVLVETVAQTPYSPSRTASQEPAENSSANHRNSANSANSASSIDPGGGPSWEPPIPFYEFDLPVFPTDALPSWLRDFVRAEAEATQTPPDLSAMLCLSVCSTACARRIAIQVREGFREPINIYSATVLPPANRKSPVVTHSTQPLEEYERDECQRNAPEIAEAKARYRIAETALKKQEDEAARAKLDDREWLTQEAVRLALEVSEIHVPVPPRLLADDSTPESLTTLLHQQQGCMAVLSAEGGIFDLMAGRYSSSGTPNFEVYLKAHAGDTLRVDRVNRPPEHIERPALTIGLAVQPEVLRGLMYKAGFRGRGLLGRFLYSLPKSPLGYRRSGAPAVSDRVRQNYRSMVQNLLRQTREVTNGEKVTEHLLYLDPPAAQRLREFEEWVEPQLSEYGELGNMTDWGGKLVGAVIRLAGLLHMATYANVPAPWAFPIQLETISNAIRIGEYLIPHAKAAYAVMGANPVIEEAKLILQWILRTGNRTFSKRQAFEGTKGHFKRVAEMTEPIQMLIEHDFIQILPAGERTKPGRPLSTRFGVNPYLHSHNSHNSQNPPRTISSENIANSAKQEHLREADE